MSDGKLSFADAAEAVLRRHSKGAPMHYRRITELAISQGLISPGRLTPEASLNAAITQEIKRRDAANRDQRFRAYGRGMYGLAQPSDPLGGAIDRKNAEVRADFEACSAILIHCCSRRSLGSYSQFLASRMLRSLSTPMMAALT
jgi:HB1, ASXL, restriction endonuclease HTH domain